jgi:hypothetical protein
MSLILDQCQTCAGMPLGHVSITGASIPVLAQALGYDFAHHQRVGPRFAAVMTSAPNWFFEVHCPMPQKLKKLGAPGRAPTLVGRRRARMALAAAAGLRLVGS